MVQTEAQYSLLYRIVQKLFQGEFTDLPMKVIENIILNLEKRATRSRKSSRDDKISTKSASEECLETKTHSVSETEKFERKKSSRRSRRDESSSDSDQDETLGALDTMQYSIDETDQYSQDSNKFNEEAQTEDNFDEPVGITQLPDIEEEDEDAIAAEEAAAAEEEERQKRRQESM